MTTKTRLVCTTLDSDRLLATITLGQGDRIGFVFGSGRHPEEPVHMVIPNSAGHIRSRVGVIVVDSDGIGVGRTPEATDHELVIRCRGTEIADVLPASPGRASVGASVVERKFFDDHLVIEVGFPPHRFEFEVEVANAPWMSRSRLATPRPYRMINDKDVALLVLAVIEPALGGGSPRVAVDELSGALGWSPRKISTIGSRAHEYFLGDPASGDRQRLTRLATHVLSRGLIDPNDVERELYPYQEEQGLR